jgi:hypothetical protein
LCYAGYYLYSYTAAFSKRGAMKLDYTDSVRHVFTNFIPFVETPVTVSEIQLLSITLFLLDCLTE